jgi:Ca-activated chloride channel family protein
MNFSNPWFLLILLPLFAQFILELYPYKKRDIFYQARQNIKDTNYKHISFKNQKIGRVLFLFGTLCLTLSTSGPQFGVKVKKVERQGVDLVIAFDTSISMNAEDIKPSRIEKAKYEIGKLIQKLKGDRVSIIVFAGTSHLYLPLTTDYEAALMFLSAIDTEMIPNQGTSISSAMDLAIATVKKDQNKYKVMIIITDGEDHEGNAIDLARRASEIGIEIHTIGVGSKIGSLIPMKKNKNGNLGYKRDKDGKLINSILNIKMLKDIAEAGDGRFFHFSNEGDNYSDLNNAIDAMEKRKINSHEYSQFEERFQPLALFSFFFFIVAFLLPTRKSETL